MKAFFCFVKSGYSACLLCKSQLYWCVIENHSAPLIYSSFLFYITINSTNRILSDLCVLYLLVSAGEGIILPHVMQKLLHFSSCTTRSNAAQWKLISYSLLKSGIMYSWGIFAGYFMDIRVFHRLATVRQVFCELCKTETFYCNFSVIRLLVSISLSWLSWNIDNNLSNCITFFF